MGFEPPHRESAAQKRLTLPITALLTFCAGVFAAQDRMALFAAMLLLLIPAWWIAGSFKRPDV